MPITLAAMEYQDQALPEPLSVRLGAGGGTIGRGEGNDLVLPDQSKHVSRVHARVFFLSGQYFLLQEGQNATQVNGEFLDQKKQVKLVSGDRLIVGPYAILVEVEPDFVVPDETLHGDSRVPPKGRIDLQLSGGGLDIPPEPFQRTSYRGDLPDRAQDPDIFTAPQDIPAHTQDPARDDRKSGPRPLFVSSQTEGNFGPAPEHDSFGDDILSVYRQSSAEPVTVDTALQSGTGGKVHPLEGGEIQTAGTADPMMQFLRGAGLEERSKEFALDPEFAFRAGSLLREAINGLLEALHANELSLGAPKERAAPEITKNVGGIPPEPSIDSLAALLRAPAASGAPPIQVRAMREAFEKLALDQTSLRPGLRAVAQVLANRTAPSTLSDPQSARAWMDLFRPLRLKAQLWDRYVEVHRRLATEVSENSPGLLDCLVDAFHAGAQAANKGCDPGTHQEAGQLSNPGLEADRPA